jgi:hypothetical protein
MIDQAVRGEKMAGIDVNGLPEAAFYGMLIPALQGARGLRRLGVRDARARDRGIRALENLLGSGSARLVELQADGMGPRRGRREAAEEEADDQLLLTLWERIGNSSSLVANDFPIGDLTAVRMSPEDAIRVKADIAKAKRRAVTTADSRLRFLISAIDSANADAIVGAESGQVYVMVQIATGMQRESIPKKALGEKGGDVSDEDFNLESDEGSGSGLGSDRLPSDDESEMV